MQLNDSIVIPIIISIVELAKGLGVPKKFSALIALVTGLLIGIFYLHPTEIKLGILEGVILGLSASGLYSGAKNTMEQIRSSRIGK